MVEESGIEKLFNIIVKYLPLMIISMMIGAGLSLLAMNYFVPEQFNSRAQLLVIQDHVEGEEQIVNNEVQSNIQLINTYQDVIMSYASLEKVASNLGIPFDYEALKEAIFVEQSPNSQAFYVYGTMNSPQVAQRLVNEVVKVFDERMNEINADQPVRIDIISDGTLNEQPVSPSSVLFFILGAVAGFVLSIVIILIRELGDNTIKDTAYLTNKGVTNIGHIYEMTNREIKKTRLPLDFKRNRWEKGE